MEEVALGKIEKCDLIIEDGWRVGFQFTLSINGGTMGCVKFDWWQSKKTRDEHTPRCVWTPEGVEQYMINTMDKIEEMMKLAKVDKFSKLAGVPIEVTTENLTIKSFRILTEVL
jgi:hypothetical protein